METLSYNLGLCINKRATSLLNADVYIRLAAVDFCVVC